MAALQLHFSVSVFRPFPQYGDAHLMHIMIEWEFGRRVTGNRFPIFAGHVLTSNFESCPFVVLSFYIMDTCLWFPD